MNTSNAPRIMIAGTGSGCGKTTVTCAILKALVNIGITAAAFKCGPDYIDPMFHTEIIGTKSRNLDTFLCGESNVRYLLARNCEGCQISVIEGVMGFYDGLGNDGSHSSYSISKITETPVILVINPQGMALSIAALIKGFKEFKSNNIAGVVINGVSPALYEMYKGIIAENSGIRVLGFLPEIPEAVIGSRHLGLVTAGEIEDLQRKINILADNAEKFIDLEGILELAKAAPALQYDSVEIEKIGKCRIAVARDKAFCFYYEDSLRLLEELGAQLTFFSPLEDEAVPGDAAGMILGGGYPELYAERLSSNKTMLESIKKAVEGGLPTYAECGGFMYLQQSITDGGGVRYPMTGALEGNSIMTGRLTRFGYTTLTAEANNLFCRKGEKINAHEFHYSDSDQNGSGFEAEKPNSGRKWNCIFANETLVAGYPHMHFYGNVNFARNFVQKCCRFGTAIT